MISYELAKQLKDAGFPQGKTQWFYDGPNLVPRFYLGEETLYEEEVAAPTLEEAVEACKCSMVLTVDVDGNSLVFHYVEDDTRIEGRGLKPLEAMCNFYLKLNNK